MLPGKIGSDKSYSGKGHDLDQWDIKLLPYDPCKDAHVFGSGVLLEKEGPYNHNYLSGILDDTLTPREVHNL